MKLAALAVLAALLVSGCATQRYGRLLPLTELERERLTCEDLELEEQKAEMFLADVRDPPGDGAFALGILGDLGIGNMMEQSAALKSGELRLWEIQDLRFTKGCPGAVQPGPKPGPRPPREPVPHSGL